MFNVLVSGNSESWESVQPWSMDAKRFLEYSDAEATDRFKLQMNLNELETIPSLLMYEWGVNGSNSSLVRFGFLNEIRPTRSNIYFKFNEQSHCDIDLVDEYFDELDLHEFERSRTHWAVKQGEIPTEMFEQMVRGRYRDFPFEIVISYASEDRAYVSQVAEFLKEKSIKLFYNKHRESDLWGKDLSQELEAIYKNHGRYCVMFVSTHYAAKAWPTLERRAAMERAIRQQDRYLLPCRFDETEVPGLPSTVSYQDCNTKSPEQLGHLILEVLRRRVSK